MFINVYSRPTPGVDTVSPGPSVDAVTMVTTFRYCVERAPMQPCHSGNTRFYINWALRCGNTSHCGERALGFVHRYSRTWDTFLVIAPIK